MRIATTPTLQRLLRGTEGFTMILAIVVLLVGGLLVSAVLIGVNGDLSLAHVNSAEEQAYDAAVAGIEVYQYRINTEPNYWTTCPSGSGGVAGSTEETYSFQTLASTGHTHTECEEHKSAAIIESKTSANGTFRIKATGKAGYAGHQSERSVVATLTHPGFLNYVFFSNYEVEDPDTITPEPKIEHCEHYHKERVEKGYQSECPAIPWVPEDVINGPFHTNDAVAACGTTKFGGSANVEVAMNGGHYEDNELFGLFCVNDPNIVGKYTEKGPQLTPPTTDDELLESAGLLLAGRTVIELKKTELTYYDAAHPAGVTQPFPSNGVIYVENEGSKCTLTYSPFSGNEDYEKDAACGDVYVKGEYTESLTIAAQKDVIVVGNITTSHESSGQPTGAGTLGLIANDFVRIFHPVKCGGFCENKRNSGAVTGTCNYTNESAGEGPPATWKWSGLTTGWGSLKEPVIDAAILSTEHSFIVDNFFCGSVLGKLTVWGGIAQDWRGRVTCCIPATSGYVKNYNYDERLKSQQPPSFLAPTSTGGWEIERETAPPEPG